LRVDPSRSDTRTSRPCCWELGFRGRPLFFSSPTLFPSTSQFPAVQATSAHTDEPIIE